MELRASEFGACIRSLVAQQLGFTPRPHDDATLALFERGNEHEVECIAALSNDRTVTHQQWEVDFLGITGHLDGVVWEIGPVITEMTAFHGCRPCTNQRVLEVKSPTSWAKFEQAYKTDTWTDALAVRYAWQTSVYMHATGLECVVACLDEGRVKTFVIERPIHDEQAIQDRLALIRYGVNFGEISLPTMRCDPSANSWFCTMSAVTGCRDKARLDIPDEDGTLSARLERYFTLTTIVQQGDAAKRERDKVKKELDELLPIGNLTVGHYSVTTWEQSGPETFDKDAMKADGVYEKYLKPKTTHRRMNVE